MALQIAESCSSRLYSLSKGRRVGGFTAPPKSMLRPLLGKSELHALRVRQSSGFLALPLSVVAVISAPTRDKNQTPSPPSPPFQASSPFNGAPLAVVHMPFFSPSAEHRCIFRLTLLCALLRWLVVAFIHTVRAVYSGC